MAFTVSRTMLNASRRLIRSAPTLTGGVMSHSETIYKGLQAQMARSLSLCKTPRETRVKPAFTSTHICSCRCAHTEGDKELSEFLSEEISREKQSQKAPAGSVQGFEIISANAAEVELEKKHDNEILSIILNVNGTVDDDEQQNLVEDPENIHPPVMKSKPPFVLKITKGDKTIAFQCSFPPPEELDISEEQQQKDYEDLLEIQEVAMLKKGEKWEDATYCVQGSIMDATMYDMMLGMLEERGIDEKFVNSLVEFSTTYEHNKYVGFLEQLKEFAERK